MIDRSRIDKRRAERKTAKSEAMEPKADPGTPRNRGWDENNAGPGGEGFSKGYGGSSGAGTGPSGPERKSKEESTRGRPR